MKLFFRHILRSIKKSPLQPIIILFTLIVSVATFITASKLAINVYKENLHYKNVDNYTCDITVKLSKSDDVRILFPDDAKSIVGSDGKVQGEFGLTALVNKNERSELVGICATDFYTANDFFDLKFTEYGEITDKNLNDSIIISTKAANKFDLAVGDILTLHLLNMKFNLRVEAIGVASGLLSEATGIIHIGAISEALANANPAIAALGDSIVPYTALKIQINDKTRIDEFADKLSSDERFSEKLIIKEYENVGSTDFFNLTSLLMISVSAAIIIVISAVVISTSLDLLAKKRMKDSALFIISGADTRQLNGILYLECIIYSALAAFFGLLLSIPFCSGINAIFEWNVEDISFKAYDIPIALFSSPAIIIMTSFLHTRKTKKMSVSERISGQFENKIGSSGIKAPVIFLILFVIALIPAFFISAKYRYVFGFLSLPLLIGFVYTFMPHFVGWVSRAFICLAEKRKNIPPKTLLAIKNTSVSYPQKHTARLITVLVTLICAVFTCLGAITKQTDTLLNLVDCEYISLGANEKTDAIIENLDEVEDTFRLSLITQLVGDQGTGILGISASEEALDFLNSEASPKKIPIGDEIVITSGLAILGNTEIGDYINLRHETNSYSFKVIEILPSSANLVFLDAAHISEENELLCIKTGAVQNSEEYKNLSNALEVRGSSIVDKDEILMPLTNRLLSYSTLLFYVINIAALATLLGIINVLFSSHIVRSRERAVYYTVGMTRKDIRLVGFLEILTVIFTALILVPLFSYTMALTLDVSLNSFGVDLLY